MFLTNLEKPVYLHFFAEYVLLHETPSQSRKPRLYQNPYQIPQPPLWGPGEVEWHVIIRCEPPTPRRSRKHHAVVIQLALTWDQDETG